VWKLPSVYRCDWAWVFVGSTLVAVLGVTFGRQFVQRAPSISSVDYPLRQGFVRWDAAYYRDIATLGYVYRPGQAPIHFMPGYPLAVRGVQELSGAPIEWAMVFTSHACLLAALMILSNYTERRYGAVHPAARAAALGCVGYFPMGMFFHMAYTESLFLLACAALVDLIDRNAHPVYVAGVAAIGLVTRHVGVALVIAVIVYAWRYGRGGWQSIGWICVCVSISLLGLACMMWHFEEKFGDWILFLRGRTDLWRLNPALPFWEKVLRLLALEPVWGMFDPDCTAYWGRSRDASTGLGFLMGLMNRLTFLAALGLTWWGVRRNVLNACEFVLALALILIPYWVNGYDNNMSSMARYMIVIAPLYPIAGVLLSRTGQVFTASAAAAGAALMGAYAALFAQGYWIG
jgi:hypothetical protein